MKGLFFAGTDLEGRDGLTGSRTIDRIIPAQDMNDWKRYAALLLPACLVFYALSFGPALQLFLKGDLSKRKLDAIYRPFLVPGWSRRVILPYARLWSSWGVPFVSWKAPYTEKEVGAFLKPGTSRVAILQRFGQPFHVERDPVFDGGGKPYDEVLEYDFPDFGHGTYGENAFAGFW